MKTCKKQHTHTYDLDVKGQDRIGIIYLHDILSHGDTPTRQIWYANIKAKKVTGRTRIGTDRRTERVIPIYPL